MSRGIVSMAGRSTSPAPAKGTPLKSGASPGRVGGEGTRKLSFTRFFIKAVSRAGLPKSLTRPTGGPICQVQTRQETGFAGSYAQQSRLYVLCNRKGMALAGRTAKETDGTN
jgi:hypothetical protein